MQLRRFVMVDISAIGGAIGSIRAAGDIANAMLKLHDAKALQDKTIELNRIILSAQQDAIAANTTQSELMSRISQLEKEIADLKSWEADKARYHLTEIGGGVVALAIKDSMRNGEAFHRICADCAASGKKSYLQPQVQGSYYDRYKCQGCGAELNVDKGAPPQRAAHARYNPFARR
jgi:hypothetical protein